jgi:tetratricopeptide (TPR) repeat protein
MKLNARLTVLAALLCALGTTTGCNFLKSRNELTLGVTAFKNAQYEQATNHFQNAVNLDPTNETAKLYLATTYASQVVPNLTTPDNLAMAQKAIDGFQQVLDKNPNDLTALKQIASIDRNIEKFDQAKEYEQKVIAQSPDDAEAFYTIAAIDFNLLHFKNTVPILAADGQTDDGQGNKKMSKSACAKIKAANTDMVKEEMTYAQKAIDLRPNYDDAMAYLQLGYREKADLDCGNPAAQKDDIDQADAWVQKAMGARKANELEKEKKANTGGVTMQ